MLNTQLSMGTIIEGPFWPEPLRVLNVRDLDTSVRIEAVGTESAQHYDRTISREQFEREVTTVTGGRHTFDAEPVLFRLAVEALRTHLAHAFDPQFAVSVSQVDPLPHQLDAVYKHMLPLPRIRFLLADDPGAGKTIMAGLLLRELMQRGDVSRVLVLCPKALTDQWRREMWERFRERFTLVAGESVSSGFGQNVWVENDQVVASVDLAIQDHILPGLEQSAHIDLERERIRTRIVSAAGAGGGFDGVVAADIIGGDGHANRDDERRGGDYARLGVARGVATTLLAHSFGGLTQSGATTQELHLGSAAPNLGPEYVTEVLRTLEESLWYVHREGDRLRFQTRLEPVPGPPAGDRIGEGPSRCSGPNCLPSVREQAHPHDCGSNALLPYPRNVSPPGSCRCPTYTPASRLRFSRPTRAAGFSSRSRR